MKNLMSAILGLITEAFSPACKFHGVFLQIGHKGQNPVSEQPAFRLLRFVNSKVDVGPAADMLASKLPGNILFQGHNSTTLICKDLDRQTSAEYVLTKTAAIKEAYLKYIKFLDEDFAANRQARRDGDQTAASTRQQEYTKEYNEKGWVKFMRAQQNIHPDVQVVPGMHVEAETQSQRLHPEQEPPAEKPDTEDEAYPEAARKKGQRYAAVSILLDDSEDMEALLFVHAVYSDMAVAKEHVEHELSEMLHPLPIDVVDMYEWIYPVQMRWEDNHLSKRVTELEETWTNDMLGLTQKDRVEAVQKNRKLKHDIMKKKEMDATVQAEIAQHLGLDTDAFMRIMDDPAFGAEAVIKWAQIDNVEERHALARAACKT